jgi:nucleotide-binding universal stress UspA family protein
MKILVAVDQNPYSAHAVLELAKLSANTWAHVSLLAVVSKSDVKERGADVDPAPALSAHPVVEALFAHHEAFLSYFEERGGPYPYRWSGQNKELVEVRKGVYEVAQNPKPGQKRLDIRVRTGNSAKEILSEAKEQEIDLIVLGCDALKGCGWEGDSTVPRKVANDAPCSVLIAKPLKEVKRMICCLDHDRVSQVSLEMINQMVTLHGAQLTIAGLTEHHNLKTEVEKKLLNILRYYHERGIDPWIEVVDIAFLDSFIAEKAREGLMALWMGKQSILEKAFSKSQVGKLIKGSDTSVLILR